MSKRTCEGCQYLNKKRKTNPCNKNFLAVYDATNRIYIRPFSCKNKPKKIDLKKELKKVKEETINLFQTYIKYRDNWTCVVCGLKVDYKDSEQRKLMHAGHFISRSVKQLLLDEKNVNAQCRTCNGQQDWIGIDPRYCAYMLNKYGNDIFNYLVLKKQESWIEPDLQKWRELRDYWKNKLGEVKND